MTDLLFQVALEEGTLEAVSHLLAKKKHLQLVDFDNHLDELTEDYLNADLNEEIERCL